MELIDERGRLFGRVNVIDALVVLLAVAVVAAGLALVFGGGGGADPTAPPGEGDETPPDTTHATVDLGEHPSYVARLVQPGNVTVNGHNATVTDVYRSPTGGDRVLLLTRMAFDGNRTDRGFVVGEDADEPMVLRHGVSFGVTTPDYQLGGTVRTVEDDPTFETRERRVVLNVSTSREVVEAISAGDTQQIAGDTVATVERAELTARDNETYYVEVTLSVGALSVDGRTEYAGGPLRLGRTLDFETDRYAVRGTVIEIGS